MSNNNPTKPVMVGVDGAPASHRGVRFAALEARSLGVPLTIVHVTPGHSGGAGVPVVPEDLLRAYGIELLEGARKTAQATVPDLEVETRLVPGGTSVHGLAHSSKDAAVLVLGAERRSFAGRVWTGDIVAGVAAQATCPVIVVPPEWDPEHEHGRIVVGIKDPEHAAALVAAGLEQAHRAGARLDVMHAWKLPSGYADIIAVRVASEDVAQRQQTLLEQEVDVHRGDHPDVDVTINVRHTQPAHALVQASADADRLLISRPHHGGVAHHLGGVARAVLQEARCPVEVHPAQSAS
jgi:nucleotide-binding universal stress UspA family protein